MLSVSSCAINYFEEEVNVVFMNEGEIVDNGTITQFKNIKSPDLDPAYVPADFRFLGWTAYTYEQLDLKDPAHFKTQYISAGRMVHYMDVKEFAVNSSVTLNALIIHKDEIPREYHYAVVAWYDRAATSGVVSGQIETLNTKLKTYLQTQGVSEEDLNTIVFRGYQGQVGATTSQIMYDGDVDIMLGWGSKDNITTTGVIPADSVLESKALAVTYNGEIKNRQIHRITDTVGSVEVMKYLSSEEAAAIFKA